ncbi:MAG: SDR family NAD(P)-dependent oxidoreductase [Treponema sp.]|jgi:sorbitol-6-phosphate 2-dehydrogenase|nr:SDR family NAD(P)-dependent oxidoreductase [Treponema sp.]
MNTLFAPVIRGAVLGKTGAPCIVKPAEQAAAGALAITAKGSATDSDVTSAITDAIKNNSAAPKAVAICFGEKTFHFTIEHGQAPKTRADVVRGKVALVTGGAQGFGEEITRGLIAEGAVVFIADLNIAGAKALAEKLNGENGKTVAYAVEVNVADEESVQKMFETVTLTIGGLDLCISNAGVLRASSILEQDISGFKFVTDINYIAFAIVTKHCGIIMKKQNLAAKLCAAASAFGNVLTTDIIQINSKSGLAGSNKNGSYAGSKFGGIGLVQSFALELIEWNIKVNAICPGNFYDGPLWSDPVKGLFVQYLNAGKVPGAKTIADVKTFYEAKSPIHRGCTGPDVLKAVFYAVEQVFETGQAIPVTGGQVMLS